MPVGRPSGPTVDRRPVSSPRGRPASPDFDRLLGVGSDACEFLKLFANQNRLQILYLLAQGEKTVSDLEDQLDIRQAALSQHLARMRTEKAVTGRREGKNVYYSIADERVRTVIDVVYDMFCKDCCAEKPCMARS
ncbi:MAG: transcriptional regulator [Hyphomicrobiales bacterium]|nr:MAG: transcriptional regulator [Hyphomicrobiales bacterium]